MTSWIIGLDCGRDPAVSTLTLSRLVMIAYLSKCLSISPVFLVSLELIIRLTRASVSGLLSSFSFSNPT